MANVVILKLLAEARKRCLATILYAAEASPWWATLTTAQQNIFRDQVRASLATFYDLTRDVVKVTDDDDTPRNEVVLDAIRAMHSDHRRFVAELGRMQ